jgi:YegS/Rv2252/BmrU family lipid kinase
VPAPTLVIANPKTGAGSRRWPKLEDALREALGELEVERTRGPRDAERIAREAVRAGVERLVVAGGDGTTSEVVTGLLSASLGDYAEIALLPMGSGCDFSRSLGLPRAPEAVIAGLAEGTRRRVDAGRISYRDRSGEPRSAYFLNVASFGISGLTDELVSRAGKHFGPSAAFGIGTVRAIVHYRKPRVEVRVDDRVVHTGLISLVTAANGRYFGSGIQVAPAARVDDGVLEVVVIGDLSKPRLIANLPSIYRGTHVTHPKVTLHRGTRIEAQVLSGEALLDVDGEPLGLLPVTIEVVPKAIQLFGLPPRHQEECEP